MEGACEAGRRACNAILERSGSTAGRSDIWTLDEPREYRVMRAIDGWLHARGRPHLFELLGIDTAARAAAITRRIAQVTGIANLDDWFDAAIRPSAIVRTVLARLGLS
jgi:hypothetical protein